MSSLKLHKLKGNGKEVSVKTQFIPNITYSSEQRSREYNNDDDTEDNSDEPKFFCLFFLVHAYHSIKELFRDAGTTLSTIATSLRRRWEQDHLLYSEKTVSRHAIGTFSFLY